MMMEINHLPAEMLLMVHQRLHPSALKKAVLVSKMWRAVGEDSTLWEWCKVTVYSREDISNLSIKRLQRIQEISIKPDYWDAYDWEAFFRALKGLSHLKKIDGFDQKIWGGLNLLETDLFARSLTKLEDVVVKRCNYDHIEALFKEMSSSTQIKTFHLLSDDLSEMEPELFARVLSRMENLYLEVYSHVTKDQMQAFFTEMMSNSSMKRLDLQGEEVWLHLKPGFLARVLSKIEDVTLADYDEVSSDHMEALFTELSFGAQMKRLGLSGNNLSEIEPALLAIALSRLVEVSLESIDISDDQLETLFINMSDRTHMKKLTLDKVDLSQLDPKLFGRVMAGLEYVNLNKSDFTTDQMLELFTEMSRNNHLKNLKINFGDLSTADPGVFAKAVTRLEAATLYETIVTNDQVMSLFAEMSVTTIMKKINFIPKDLDLSSVDPEVLATALIRLEEVSVLGTGITHHQATVFFSEMSRNSHLKKLKVVCGRFFGVDPEVLATAVANVKEVELFSCRLSQNQITSIFAHVLEADKKIRKLKLSYIYGGSPCNVNPEILRKVKEKLKGELNIQV